jgi:outer membrane usher protein
VPVGRDGRTYLTGLDRQNEVSVELPGGQTCKAVFDFVAVSGQIPTIGPVPCT